jgi:hypothetical protein
MHQWLREYLRYIVSLVETVWSAPAPQWHEAAGQLGGEMLGWFMLWLILRYVYRKLK